MNLGSDLGHSICFPGELGHDTRFRDGTREWLLAIEMPPASQGRHAGHRMGVIRSGHHDGVQILLIDQPSKIPMDLGARKLFRDRAQTLFVYIAQGGHVGDLFELTDAVSRLPRRTNESDVQLVVGSDRALRSKDLRGRRKQACRSTGAPREKARRFDCVAFIVVELLQITC